MVSQELSQVLASDAAECVPAAAFINHSHINAGRGNENRRSEREMTIMGNKINAYILSKTDGAENARVKPTASMLAMDRHCATKLLIAIISAAAVRVTRQILATLRSGGSAGHTAGPISSNTKR